MSAAASASLCIAISERHQHNMANQTTDLPTLLHSLEKNFSSNLFTSLPPLLTRGKLLLSAHDLLIPSPKAPEPQLNLARTIFEIGAYTSIRLKDKDAFVSYMGYLQNFYSLGLGGDREPELTGLNLLRLLAENKIAEFHTQLEIIDVTAQTVAESEPVKFAKGLEEWIQEGAYNRVWKAGEGRTVNVYQKFFLDVLMDTIRYLSHLLSNEGMKLQRVLNGHILPFLSLIPKYSYSSPHKITLGSRISRNLYNPHVITLMKRNWSLSNRGFVSFPPPAPSTISSTDEAMSDIPEHMMNVGGLGALYSVGGEKVIKYGLDYAGELEKVI
jgi:hypothetical protein